MQHQQNRMTRLLAGFFLPKLPMSSFRRRLSVRQEGEVETKKGAGLICMVSASIVGAASLMFSIPWNGPAGFLQRISGLVIPLASCGKPGEGFCTRWHDPNLSGPDGPYGEFADLVYVWGFPTRYVPLLVCLCLFGYGLLVYLGALPWVWKRKAGQNDKREGAQ